MLRGCYLSVGDGWRVDRGGGWTYGVAVEGCWGVEARCRGGEGRCCEQGGEEGWSVHGGGCGRVAVGEMEGGYVR